MSEDSKDKPPAKLTLSRGLKAQADTEAAKVKAETAVNKPAPVMKLKRREEDSESPSTAASTAAGESPKAPPSTQTPSPADETPSEKKPAFDPKNPFGNSAASPIKAGEINPPRPTPSAPQQTQPTTPLTDDGASAKGAKGAKGVKGAKGANVEQAISSLKSEEQEVRSKSILPSIIIIIILLIILAAAGFGLWKVLNLSKDDDVATAASSKNESAESIETSTPSSQAPKNPIEKAKAAIAKVPTADVDVITAPPSVPVSSPPAIVAPPEVEPKLPAAADSKASNSAIEANKQAVSQYLSSIHIGGLRKGERPMVILGGERFDVGDIVQAETGLKFDGLRNGRLAFRDHHGIVYLKSF